jgi:hypothetical protein
MPYAVLLGALLLTPLAAWLAEVSTRHEYRDNPPGCYGLGGGCELEPSDAGAIAKLLYVAIVVLTFVMVGLLHLGGRRLAIARSLLSIGVVGFVWAWIIVFSAVPFVRAFT